jgi:negative regulator of flagellin synthesis FlgM
MTDSISKLYGSPSLDKATLDKTKRKAVDTGENSLPTTVKAPSSSKDEVVLSNITQQAMAEPAFDRNKVEAIKREIEAGNYPLNSRKIAESFMAFESVIGKQSQ